MVEELVVVDCGMGRQASKGLIGGTHYVVVLLSRFLACKVHSASLSPLFLKGQVRAADVRIAQIRREQPGS